MTPIKLSAYAESIGISYRKALRMYHAGTLGVETVKADNGIIMVKPSSFKSVLEDVKRLTVEEQIALAHYVLNTGGIK